MHRNTDAAGTRGGPEGPPRCISATKNHPFIRLLLTTCLLLTADLQAQERWSAWLAGSALDIDYTEFDDSGAWFNAEDGWIGGIETGAEFRHDDWSVHTTLGWWKGTVDYASRTATAETDEEILDFHVRAGRVMFRQHGTTMQLNAGLGYRDWQRDIAPGNPAALYETYTWAYGSLGLQLRKEFNARTALSADVHISRPLNPEIKVNFAAGNDPVTLDLGEENGFRLALAVEHRLQPGLSLRISPWYEAWDLGRSPTVTLTQNGMPVGFVNEPRSETRNIGISLGLKWYSGMP